MKRALLLIDGNRSLDVADYIFTLKPLLSRYAGYSAVDCVFYGCGGEPKPQSLYDNLRVILNIDSDGKVRFFDITDLVAVRKTAGKVADCLFVSRIMKSPFFRDDIQHRKEFSVKVSKILCAMDIISAVLGLNADDVYLSYHDRSLFEQAKYVANELQKSAGAGAKSAPSLPDFVCGTDEITGLDGNVRIARRFSNTFDILSHKEEIFRRIKTIFTDPNHIKVTDKGRTSGNPLFLYVEQLCEPQDVEAYFSLPSVAELKRAYEQGGIGDFRVKEMLFAAVMRLFEPLQRPVPNETIEAKIQAERN